MSFRNFHMTFLGWHETYMLIPQYHWVRKYLPSMYWRSMYLLGFLIESLMKDYLQTSGWLQGSWFTKRPLLYGWQQGSLIPTHSCPSQKQMICGCFPHRVYSCGNSPYDSDKFHVLFKFLEISGAYKPPLLAGWECFDDIESAILNNTLSRVK